MYNDHVLGLALLGNSFTGMSMGFGDSGASAHTQPVGLARPATLQAPFAGPLGNSS